MFLILDYLSDLKRVDDIQLQTAEQNIPQALTNMSLLMGNTVRQPRNVPRVYEVDFIEGFPPT